ACQKVITFHPNSPGSSQFQRCITISPKSATKAAIASGATKKIHLFLITQLFSMSSSSFPRKLVVHIAQTIAQCEHRVTLAREQRVDVDAALRRQFLEAATFQFVRDKNLALLGGQFVE